VLALCVVAGAGSQASSGPPFFDRTGDAPAPFDITRLDVSQKPDGAVYIQVTLAGTVNWDEDGPLVALDLDQNPDTGSAFYGTEVEFAFQGEGNAREGSAVLFRSHGWDFQRATTPDYWFWSLGPHIVGYFFMPWELGLGPRDGFNVVAATLGPHADTAPDIRTFNYQPLPGTQPPTLGPDRRAPHVIAYPADGVHGKVATLDYWVLDGRGRTAETIRVFRGKHLLKTIRRPLRNSNPFDQSKVTWRVPKSVRGHLRFTVRAADAAGNRSKAVSAPLEIR
jgi:hypothetical protein